MRTKFIRYKRIVYHYLAFLITKDIRHFYEVGHYYYMKKCKE
jgi:hypothetical protein